jgi:hypothetical protein
MSESLAPVHVQTIQRVERDWTSPVYPRFNLKAEEINRLLERFLPNEILTVKDIRNEFHSMECWLRDNPVRASHKRSWYKFSLNWLARCEEKLRRVSRRGDHVSADTIRSTREETDRVRAALRRGRTP